MSLNTAPEKEVYLIEHRAAIIVPAIIPGLPSPLDCTVFGICDTVDLAHQHVWQMRTDLNYQAPAPEWFAISREIILNKDSTPDSFIKDPAMEFYGAHGLPLDYQPITTYRPEDILLIEQDRRLIEAFKTANAKNISAVFKDVSRAAPIIALTWYEHLSPKDRQLINSPDLSPLTNTRFQRRAPAFNQAARAFPTAAPFASLV